MESIMANVSTELVWEEIEKNIFAVLGMVSSKHEARTAGIMYVARQGKLYITSDKNAWKTRHIAANPHVSLTVAIPKSVPLMPWIKVPAATITFAGEATLVAPDSLDADLRQPALRPRRRRCRQDRRFHSDRRRAGRRVRHLRRGRLAHGDARHRQSPGPRAGAAVKVRLPRSL
jgi:hypothetical protein